MSTFCHILKTTPLILTKLTLLMLRLCEKKVTCDIISSLYDRNHEKFIYVQFVYLF